MSPVVWPVTTKHAHNAADRTKLNCLSNGHLDERATISSGGGAVYLRLVWSESNCATATATTTDKRFLKRFCIQFAHNCARHFKSDAANSQQQQQVTLTSESAIEHLLVVVIVRGRANNKQLTDICK